MLDIYLGVYQNQCSNISTLKLSDTSGDHINFVESRRAQLKVADVVVICVASNDRQSFDDLDLWITESRSACPEKPICLFSIERGCSESRTDSDGSTKSDSTNSSDGGRLINAPDQLANTWSMQAGLSVVRAMDAGKKADLKGISNEMNIGTVAAEELAQMRRDKCLQLVKQI